MSLRRENPLNIGLETTYKSAFLLLTAVAQKIVNLVYIAGLFVGIDPPCQKMVSQWLLKSSASIYLV